MRLYHGTSSSKAELIRQDGFLPVSYFTPSVDDALYYAATGGEADLQHREEAWEEQNGYPPREDYGPDLWLMFEHLYPKGDNPVIVIVEMNEERLAAGRPDNGAEGGVVFDAAISTDVIVGIVDVDWSFVEMENYNPIETMIASSAP